MSIVVPNNKVYVQPVDGQQDFIRLPGETLYDIGAQTFETIVGEFPKCWDRKKKVSYIRKIIEEHPQSFTLINLDPLLA